jgi:toxin ParE1/3/4
VSLPVILRPEATQDLQDARDWYEQQSTGLGAVFATRAATALDAVGQSPELYGVVWQDVRAAPIRRHPYIVYYRMLADRVEVLAVLHARRDPAAWQSRA